METQIKKFPYKNRQGNKEDNYQTSEEDAGDC